MPRARSYVLVAVTIAAPCAGTSRLARADDTTSADVEEARTLFREAVEREDAGDLAEAVVLYRRALAHAVSPQLLFNIGSCEERLDRLLDAARTFREAEREARARGNDEVLQEARARLRDLEKITPQFVVQLPAGRESTRVLVDDVPRVTSDGPVLVDPGEHRLVAHAPDGAAFEIVIGVRRGDRRTVAVVFPTSTAGRTLALSPPAGAPPLDSPRASWVPAGIAASATLVLGAVAAGTFAAGRAKKERYVRLNDAPTRENEAERVALSDEGRTLYAASTVLAISAAAAGAATAWFVVRSLATRGAQPRGATTTAPWLLPNAQGVSFGGAF